MGRSKKELYDRLGFELLKENNKYGAQCLRCNVIIRNTSQVRLKGHRKACKFNTETPVLSPDPDYDNDEPETNGEIRRRKKKRKRKSTVWTVFDKSTDGFAKCRICEVEVKSSGSTSGLLSHIKRSHPDHWEKLENMTFTEPDDEEETQNEDSLDNSTTEGSSRKRKKSSGTVNRARDITSILNADLSAHNNVSSSLLRKGTYVLLEKNQDDEFDIVSKNIAHKLKKLPVAKRYAVERQIMDLLYNAQFEDDQMTTYDESTAHTESLHHNSLNQDTLHQQSSHAELNHSGVNNAVNVDVRTVYSSFSLDGIHDVKTSLE